MPMSPYQKELRQRVGDMLIVQPGVAALIRDEQGRVLLQLRADDGSWALPAGGISPGEEPAKALVREVFEETGLKVRPSRLLAVMGGALCRYTYPDGNTDESVSLLFECEVLGGKLRSVDGESDALKYFPPDKMPESPMSFPCELFTAPDSRPLPYIQWEDEWLEAVCKGDR
jgi:8-oxo-dGTP pyrophosphatase MutT (NUDIX family)